MQKLSGNVSCWRVAASLVAGVAVSAALAGVAVASGMSVSSPAFSNHRIIPRRYTCDGADTSPPLRFRGVPRSARWLALTVVDPNGQGSTPQGFTHWTVWN